MPFLRFSDVEQVSSAGFNRLSFWKPDRCQKPDVKECFFFYVIYMFIVQIIVVLQDCAAELLLQHLCLHLYMNPEVTGFSTAPRPLDGSSSMQIHSSFPFSKIIAHLSAFLTKSAKRSRIGLFCSLNQELSSCDITHICSHRCHGFLPT